MIGVDWVEEGYNLEYLDFFPTPIFAELIDRTKILSFSMINQNSENLLSYCLKSC